MLTLSLTVCKQLVCRNSIRLISSSIAHNCIVSLPNDLLDLSGSSRKAPDSTRPGIKLCTKFLREFEENGDIPWDDLTKKLEDHGIQNPRTKILQACVRLEKLDSGLDYYNYMVQKGQKLSMLDLLFFCKLLSSRKEEIPKYEEELISFYYNIKEYLASSSVVRQAVLPVLVEIPSIFNDIIKIGRPPRMRTSNMSLIIKAIDSDLLEEALDFANDVDFTANTKFIDSYINYCIRKIENGKFSVDYIQRLVDLCADRVIPFYHENLLAPLQSLVDALMKHQNAYHWSVHSCLINQTSVCSNCGQQLLPKGISKEEFSGLKKELFQLLFADNVFLKSSDVELQRFLTFLKGSKPYNLVLDGLNVMFRTRNGKGDRNMYLKYFVDQGFRVLTISRIHSKKNLTNPQYLNKKYYEKNCQFFFTTDLSDDDAFLLHAALYGGLNTYFLTGDYLSSYATQLSQENRRIFYKWQASHQYRLISECQPHPPLPHCGLPQLTFSEGKHYIWHISTQPTEKLKLNIFQPIQWYCLKAVNKSTRQSFPNAKR